MNLDGTKKDNIIIGMRVIVNPQNDRTRQQLVNGSVSEILTKSDTHSHGILVKLDDGTIGRVKSISANHKPQNNSSKNSDKPAITLSDLIREGENQFVEFKSSILWSKFKNKEEIEKSKSYELKKYGQNASKFIIAKSLCGFLNSEGGTLIIGVKEVKESDEVEIIGVESEYSKLKDKTQDGYRRMVLDEIIKPYLPSQVFNHFNEYLSFCFEEIDGKLVFGIIVKPSDVRVFVKISNEDIFFVRIDASTRQVAGPDMVDYCARRFK